MNDVVAPPPKFSVSICRVLVAVLNKLKKGLFMLPCEKATLPVVVKEPSVMSDVAVVKSLAGNFRFVFWSSIKKPWSQLVAVLQFRLFKALPVLRVATPVYGC